MANVIEYIFRLTDRISGPLQAVVTASGKATGSLNGLQKTVRSVPHAFDTAGRAVEGYNKKIYSLQGGFAKLDGWISRNGSRIKTMAADAFNSIPGANLVTNPLVAASAAIGFAGKSAVNFDQNMAKVNITAQLDGKAYSGLRNKLKQIAKDNKADIQVAPIGFEKINSQLNDVDLSLSILDASLKGSKAGFTDLDTVSGALAQTLSIVGKENASAAEVLDTFFAAKRVGAGEFADFARYMPNLIAGASNLGIAYKEVAGTFAYMTGKGQSAERAAVLMENAFSVLGRADVRGKMKAAGVDVFDKDGKIRSVVDIFGDLQKVLGGLDDEQKSTLLEKLGLVDKEAKNAFAILTADITKLQTSMRDVGNAAGETNKALNFSQNAAQRATEVWNTFKNTGLELGELILPLVGAGLDVLGATVIALYTVVTGLNSAFSWWGTQLREGSPLIWGVTAAVSALSVALAIGYAQTKAAVIIAKIKAVWDGVQAVATKGLTVAQWALNAAFLASPLGWIVLAIGAVVAAVVYCWNHFEGFRKVILGTWEVIKVFGVSLFNSIVTPFQRILSGLGRVGAAISALLKGNFKEAAGEAKAGAKEIAAGFMAANPVSAIAGAIKDTDFSGAWQKGNRAGAESWAVSSKKDADSNPSAAPVGSSVAGVTGKTDFNGLLSKLTKTGKGGKSKTLNLNDTAGNYSQSAEYLAATQKLAPVTVSFSPGGNALSPAAGKVPGAAGSAAAAPGKSQKEEEYAAQKTNYLADIMQNVRRIAAAAALPVALAASPSGGSLTNADALMANTREPATAGFSRPAAGQGRTIQVGKMCEQMVFHVQNTDQKGLETIRNEVINVLNTICEYEV